MLTTIIVSKLLFDNTMFQNIYFDWYNVDVLR